MYLIIKQFYIFVFILLNFSAFSQQEQDENFNQLEFGFVYATAEANYYGLFGKYSFPITKKKNHFRIGVSFTSYFDFVGESEPNAELTNDVDMRLIPAVFIGYNFRLNKFNFSLEVPVGTSIAITKGTLENTNIGFTRSYSNKDIFWHFGGSAVIRYAINKKNEIGLYVFVPLLKDIAWSLPPFGIGWMINL